MSFYLKCLLDLVGTRMPDADGGAVVEMLFRLGVIDHTLTRVLIVREYVAGLVRGGESLNGAMWRASEAFACTYEYVRRCLYYYRDINWSQCDS